MKERDILHLIASDDEMMAALRAVETLSLPDWMIGAGFVRNKVWDYLHDFDKKTVSSEIDIDVVYLDGENQDEALEAGYEKRLDALCPGNWSVTNQVRMAKIHGHEPYKSSEEAISYWPETATCLGVKIEDGELNEDLFQLVFRQVLEIIMRHYCEEDIISDVEEVWKKCLEEIKNGVEGLPHDKDKFVFLKEYVEKRCSEKECRCYKRGKMFHSARCYVYGELRRFYSPYLARKSCSDSFDCMFEVVKAVLDENIKNITYSKQVKFLQKRIRDVDIVTYYESLSGTVHVGGGNYNKSADEDVEQSEVTLVDKSVFFKKIQIIRKIINIY